MNVELNRLLGIIEADLPNLQKHHKELEQLRRGLRRELASARNLSTSVAYPGKERPLLLPHMNIQKELVSSQC